jgi:cell cycle sensor histidine kinase DivJ
VCECVELGSGPDKSHDWQNAASAVCERLVSPAVTDAETRAAHARLIGCAFGGAFILSAGFMSIAGRIDLGPLLAGVSSILAAGFSLALVVAATGRLRLARAGLIATGIATVALLIAIAGGLASPLVLLAAALGNEARRLSTGPRAWATGIGAAVAALLGSAALVAALPVAGTASGWQWVAPALYGIVLALRSQHRGTVRDQAGQGEPAEDELLLADRVCMTIDGSGEVRRVSANAEAMLSIAPELLAGSGFFDRLRVTDRVAYRCAVAEAAAGRAVSPLEISLRLPADDGAARYRIYRMIFAPLANGETGVRALLEPRDELSELRRALAEAREQMDEGDTAKSRFLAAVSHELRTPLNAIIGFSDMLMAEEISGPMAERQREQVGHVREAGYHLLSVVNAILDVTKIESGTYTIEGERFDLGRTVTMATSMLCEQAGAKKITVTTRLDADTAMIFADQRAVQQMLINLLSNAIKFTPEGGKVEITARRRGGNVLVSVSDTGIGIAADDLERLGKPFAQVQNDYTRQFEGTGLGLSLVKGLVELHGGMMNIESAPGLGTTVTIGLPDVPARDEGLDEGDRHEAPRKIA